MKKTTLSSTSKILATAVVGSLGSLPIAAEAAESKLVGSVRIGLTYEDNAGNDGEFALVNFGSRLIWTGSNAITDSLEGIARVELGLNPDANSRGNSGIDRTRQLWAGVKGGFGTIKWGAQYAAFYDMVQGNTDIAWWGSCWTQLECSRETNVLKYSGGAGGLSWAASAQLFRDNDEELFDQFEFGLNYGIGDWTVGAAASIHADATDDAGAPDDGGTLVGAVVKGDIGPGSIALTIQSADEDFANGANGTDDVVNTTLAATLGNVYLVANGGDSGDFATLGYTLNIGDNALMYFEAQTIENSPDDDFIGRATFKYDF